MPPQILNDFADLVAAATASPKLPSSDSECIARLRKRIDHLTAEIDALKASHAEAVAAAVVERERRLQEQEEHLQHLRAVMMRAADGILTTDEAGSIDWFNERAAAIFGYAPAEVVGRPLTLLQPREGPTRRPTLAECVLRQSGEATGGVFETEGCRKDGSVFPLEISVSEIIVGERRCHAVILRDISERKLLETQLRQAQKLESIGQLAAGIAHEINTPTQYIGDNVRFLNNAFADLLRLIAICRRIAQGASERCVPPELLDGLRAVGEEIEADFLCEEIPKAISQTLEGVERVAAIVRSMKEFSHPGSGERQAVDINRALEATVTVSRNEWKYVADVRMDLAADLPPVACYAGDCNQVFLNLIVNAAHAIAERIGGRTGEKGLITIATRREGNWAVITISDTGTGIPEAIRGRIFDPFFTTKPVGRGTGQGLAIAHSIVTEKHGGTIGFDTEVGRGTTFTIRLPITVEGDLTSAPG